MDFLTHSLAGATTARLFTRLPEALPSLALAGVLGSLLMDFDSWLALLGPGMYGRWHRVVSHSLAGLAGCALLAAVLVLLVWKFSPARRFGWFVSPNLSPGVTPATPVAARILGVCLAAAVLHALGDMITGFGNVQFFWPWSTRDFSLSAVNSFDAVLLALTFAWHVSARRWGGLQPRREAAFFGVWFLLAAAYITARLVYGSPTVW